MWLTRGGWNAPVNHNRWLDTRQTSTHSSGWHIHDWSPKEGHIADSASNTAPSSSQNVPLFRPTKSRRVASRISGGIYTSYVVRRAVMPIRIGWEPQAVGIDSFLDTAPLSATISPVKLPFPPPLPLPNNRARIPVDIRMFQIDAGWWRGVCNGQYGLFPANYVELK